MCRLSAGVTSICRPVIFIRMTPSTRKRVVASEFRLEKPLALGGWWDILFGPVLGDRPPGDQYLALAQPRRNFFVLEGMICIFVSHHFLDHFPNRHRREHVAGLIRPLKSGIEEELQLQHPLRAV